MARPLYRCIERDQVVGATPYSEEQEEPIMISIS